MKGKFLLTITYLISSLFALAQSHTSYIIRVKVKGAPDGTIFYLIRTNERGKADTVTRKTIMNEVFTMKGTLTETPQIHFVKMDTSVVKTRPKKSTWIRILLDNSNIFINGNVQEWASSEVKGSDLTEQYDSLSKNVSQLIDIANEKIKADPNDRSKVAQLKYDLAENIMAVLKVHSDYFAAPAIAANMPIMGADRWEEVFNAMTPRVKESFYGKKLKNSIASLKASQKISSGNVIPDFSVLSPDNQSINILAAAAKNKLTLVDFWASWCKPCRAEIPNLLKVYNKFHKKGFGILGISSDESEAEWKKALAEDNTPWVNGREKSYRVGKEMFRLQSIPAYVLIDNKGRMIAFDRGVSTVPAFGPDIRGEELLGTVERLLSEMESKKE